jgi:hypothetical protein
VKVEVDGPAYLGRHDLVWDALPGEFSLDAITYRDALCEAVGKANRYPVYSCPRLAEAGHRLTGWICSLVDTELFAFHVNRQDDERQRRVFRSPQRAPWMKKARVDDLNRPAT